MDDEESSRTNEDVYGRVERRSRAADEWMSGEETRSVIFIGPDRIANHSLNDLRNTFERP